ncbi:glutathione S-transferase [Paraburkholderia dipogonis]|uniref:Glutathione S-transferase n=1 Tax=Paraburkholderia dipogonis TaxID=1211383 RepID=A0A4Y8MVK8_9BURK|nr:glutathione S-transferase [Paraburkholderia dipogonis]TFE41428.1 glutathione S-transferase [Paraburkholderia dipogonis]
MTTETLTLYHSTASPNSRRVRIFLAEKGVTVTLAAVDLGKREQHGDAYRAINPRRVVPTLVLDDGTSIGEVPAIQRYIEDVYPDAPLFGSTPKDKALITMWERRAEQEGFASVMEAIRNTAPGLKGRAIAGPHDYEQIAALAERSRQRVVHFMEDLDDRLKQSAFVAGERFSVADITALVTIDFAAKAIDLQVPADLKSLRRWYDAVSSRPSATA